MNKNNKMEIKQIYNLVGVKQVLIIEGNVDDLYEINGKYVNVHMLFNEIFSDKGYYKRYKFDKYSSFTRLVDEDNLDTTLKYSKSVDLFSELQKVLPSNDELVGFLVDYTNYIFSGDASNENDQIALTAFFKALKENEFNITEIGDLKSCVIFITKQINQLPPDMYLNNPDVAILKLPKPSRYDRKVFINTVRSKLTNITDIFTEVDSFVDYTEGWTLKEISHFVRYVSNLNSQNEFKKVINNYLYGDSISPWQELTYEKVKSLDFYLKEKVIGQNYVVEKVKNIITKASIGLSGITYSENQTKPKGTLFFVGPTGVGKTEMAKAITQFLFGDESNLIRFDMSEYSTDNADQKLIGAPPGYVGFEGGGQLTNAVKEKPFSVVLFDEIEKANPKILDKFLQILEDGRLTDNSGKTVSFSETLIIFTSNIGSSKINENDNEEVVRNNFINYVHDYFYNKLNRPEILGRIGNNIIPFNFIKSKDTQYKIVNQKVKSIIKSIQEKYNSIVELNMSDNMLTHILKDADVTRGGRDVINSIEVNLVDPLANFIFENLDNINNGQGIVVDYENCITFNLK